MLVVCPQCFAAVRVLDNDDERVATLVGARSDFHVAGHHCLECNARCTVREEIEVASDLLCKLRVRDLDAEQYFAALMGLGTPDEAVCDGGTVRKLLVGQTLKAVHGSDVAGTGRYRIDKLELADGTTLYLGASAAGAIVYRITRPLSYVARVLHDH